MIGSKSDKRCQTKRDAHDKYEPNSTLNSGIHLVQYIARDFAGNTGMCSFEINITIRSEGRACSDLRVWETDNTIYENLIYKETKYVYTRCKYRGLRVDGENTIECVHGHPVVPLPRCKPIRLSMFTTVFK
ncbi:hypothetical protein CEXT_361271 [Caerostris extrusa]|uniref:HYR domain-containing protein n=1 Tax=Caerostris extrusa TaxID=172846 RepID=A0AAV4XTS3_CAEEX|nr:hypothetical protein CEXT_361271 [Caerostris extrusa]